jgi:hypothetical protein
LNDFSNKIFWKDDIEDNETHSCALDDDTKNESMDDDMMEYEYNNVEITNIPTSQDQNENAGIEHNGGNVIILSKNNNKKDNNNSQLPMG